MIYIIPAIFLIGISTIFYFVFWGKKEEEIVYEEVRDPVVLHIAVPRQNDKTPLASEQMFASLHGILRDNERSIDFLSFEIESSKDGGINFYAVVPKYLFKFVEGQIYAQYPNAEITLVEDYLKSPILGVDPKVYRPYISTGEIELSRDFMFPIKTFRDFEVDPLAAITSSLSDIGDGEQAMVQILVRPVANNWQEYAKEYIEAVRDGKEYKPVKGSFVIRVLKTALKVVVGIFDFLMTSPDSELSSDKPMVKLLPGQEEELSQISDKMTKVGFEMGLRIVTKAETPERSQQILQDIIASFKQFSTANLNNFVMSQGEYSGAELYDQFKRRFLSTDAEDILTISELASLYHLPNISVETPNIAWSRAKKYEPPMNLPTQDATIFAETDFRGKRLPFGIKRKDRRMHYYMLGKTGTGKSTVFKNMIISDILAGDGVGVVDPHGELVEDILNFIPSERLNDVVYLDPSDTQNPVGFNLLELYDPDQRDMIADGVVEVFKKHFDSWGPRLQYLLHNAILTALEAEGTSLLAVQRMLVDKNYRKYIVKQIKDPVLIKFWNEEFAAMATNSRLVTEAVAPIQNKVGRFLSSSTIRNIVGQVSSTINLADIMNTRKIFLVNLSQGKLGEESSALLGGMIVTRLQTTAMERVRIPEDERKDFFLYVDEFQNFATDSFAKILSEARKYRLCLNLTHQYIDQLSEEVRMAIFGNVGTLATFVVGPTDADVMAKEFSPIFTEEDVVALDRHSMYVKMSIDGMISTPFSARSLDLRYERNANKEKAIRISKERYGRSREEVEDKILKWSNQNYSEKGNRSRGSSRSGHDERNSKKDQRSNAKVHKEQSNRVTLDKSKSKKHNNKKRKNNKNNEITISGNIDIKKEDK